MPFANRKAVFLIKIGNGLIILAFLIHIFYKRSLSKTNFKHELINLRIFKVTQNLN